MTFAGTGVLCLVPRFGLAGWAHLLPLGYVRRVPRACVRDMDSGGQMQGEKPGHSPPRRAGQRRIAVWWAHVVWLPFAGALRDTEWKRQALKVWAHRSAQRPFGSIWSATVPPRNPLRCKGRGH